MSATSAPSTPPKPESGFARLKSFRSPTRAFTLSSPRPASPTTTTGSEGRRTPTRSSTRDSVPSSTTKRSSIFPFQSRKSGLGSSTNPSSDAVHETDSSAAKVEEPASITDAPKAADAEVTQEPATEAPKDESKPVENTTGHVRARSGSTISSSGPLTPPPVTQAAEPVSISKTDGEADPTDSPHDGASVVSRSPSRSRLRRQISNISRHSLTGSLRRVSLLGPASPPQVETAPAIGEMEHTLSRSSSASSMRRLASPEPPAPQTQEPLVSEPISQTDAPLTEAPAEAPLTEEPAEAPAEVPAEAPAPAPVETPVPAPVETPAPAPETAASVEAPQTEAPKSAEPSTPPKQSMSRNASTTSLTKSPATPGKDKPKPERRGTLGWARNALNRKASGSGPTFARPPSRGADSGVESDGESVKERERGWNTGKPVPPPVVTPKKSEDNIKRRFSLGRRSSESGHVRAPSDSASESDKKTNWSKVFRAGSKSKKDKTDSSSLAATSTAAPSTVEVAPVPVTVPESRPSLSIPDNVASIAVDQRPLSAIVESPVMPLNSQAVWASDAPTTTLGTASSPLAISSTPVPESPVDIKPEDVISEPELIEAPKPEPTLEAAAEPVEVPAEPVVVPASPVLNEVGNLASPSSLPNGDAHPEEQAVTAESVVPEEVQPKDALDAPESSTAPTSGAVTPAPVETEVAGVAPESVVSPMSPNSPTSTPWDPKSQREIARARSPRRSSAVGGSSIRSRLPSPAPSIIGVKRKQPDEPEVGKARVRYLPDWAVSPAIQLALTLSFVLPRRRRDVANPTNRRRGWWPLSRGPRTEMRYNAIRGVNEEVPIVSRSWTVPAAVRTTAKVVTAPARWMFHFFVPRSTTN